MTPVPVGIVTGASRGLGLALTRELAEPRVNEALLVPAHDEQRDVVSAMAACLGRLVCLQPDRRLRRGHALAPVRSCAR